MLAQQGAAVGSRTEAGRSTWQRYWASAIDVPGPETDRLAQIAEEAGLHLCVGAVERDSTHSGGTLFCTLLYFGPGGFGFFEQMEVEFLPTHHISDGVR